MFICLLLGDDIISPYQANLSMKPRCIFYIYIVSGKKFAGPRKSLGLKLNCTNVTRSGQLFISTSSLDDLCLSSAFFRSTSSLEAALTDGGGGEGSFGGTVMVGDVVAAAFACNGVILRLIRSNSL